MCFVLAFVKCTRIYFSGANYALFFSAHSKYCSWTVNSVLQLFSVNLPKARASTSLINLVPDAGIVRVLQMSMRLAL